MGEIEDSQVDVLAKLKELVPLYFAAKENTLFAENLIGRFPAQPILEIRNSFDHVIRLLKTYSTKDYIESREHLKRAALDSLELIAVDKFEKFNQVILKLDFKIFSPSDYLELRRITLKIANLQNDFSKLRLQRNHSSDMEVIKDYEEKVTELSKEIDEFHRLYSNKLESVRPDIQRYSEKTGFLAGVFSSILILIVLFLILHLFHKV